MPAPQPERAKLGTEKEKEMHHLTSELKEVLKKISKIVHSEVGAKDAYNVVTIVAKGDNNPLQIGFRNTKVREARANMKEEEGDEIGYYIEPPGVCTTVPACLPE
jgi:hypothetical protein